MGHGAPRSSKESERLAALRALEILDTPAEESLDDIVRIASEICQAPIALVSLVDDERQWFKAKVGLDATETPRDVAFCAHAILEDELFVVEDALTDARFADNPLVTHGPRIRFYAGAPIRVHEEHNVGTLCVIDRVPRALTPTARSALLALRRQVEAHFALRLSRQALVRANAELVRLQRAKDGLVQFVVHDMKNALTSITMDAEALFDESLPGEEVREIAGDIGAAAGSLGRLIVNLMDVGESETGGGLFVTRTVVAVEALWRGVVAGVKRRIGEAEVTARWEGPDLEVTADVALLKRVLENLVDNALRYAPRGSAIVASASRRGDEAVIRVQDSGPGVPADLRDSIFELYTQATRRQSATRGLGLAFCRLAVLAHGGRIWVEETPGGGSTFCVRL